jgi:hypothetical protein
MARFVKDRLRSEAARKSKVTGAATAHQGDIGELKFALKAAEMGFRVSRPFNGAAPYDWVVEKDGRMLRVQVKHSKRHHRQGSVSYQFSSQCNFSEETSDIVVCIGEQGDAWVVPTAAVSGVRQFTLSPLAGRKFREFKGRWDLMTAALKTAGSTAA